MKSVELQIREVYRCTTCGALRVFVQTGLVCQNGCGRIVPIPTDLRMRMRRRILAPYAKRLSCGVRQKRFALDDRPGVFRLAPRRRSEDAVRGRLMDGRLRWFVLAEAGN